MKYEIKNRWNGQVIFEAEIQCDSDASNSIKIGLAVRAAYKADANLSDANLSDANLSGANLSGANLSGANLRGAYLRGANLRDANLSDANLSDANLSDANLSDANLSGANLSGANLSGANLRGANLRGANLRDANLSDANLSGANLSGANLNCPVKIDSIHSKVFAAASAGGALNMSDWHTCDTTHCRAGWVVFLAGDAGSALEWAIGTPAAAAAIYLASDPILERVPDFYCNNEEALADMKRLAELEAERNKESVER